MNTASLKSYGPHARRTFIEAVTAQAARYGIRPGGNDPATVQGDVLLVAGHAFPKSVALPRKRLVERIEAHGFDATMESVAYTWFNRLAAIRYMEVHGYLEHGFRVLSHPEGHGRPEILDHAADLDLPGLDRDRAVELKLDGTRDEELYRLLLLAQCNALHTAMPFLFEKIGHEAELLLPANLLHTDSLIRQLVEQVDEELWQDIEIIGWLYQFYISEKKDEVIGKVVKSEDIPAATQLFTPNWIVKYMVQNSLGAQWLATYPDSPLKGQMEYYIEPAEQTDEVNAQLEAITPSQLNPEELTLIDPASGSGHILVEAYELFKAIYLERGYRQRDVPQLILEKNLFGLDIDERAAQLTGFALMMKGRADDRRLFERGVKLNVLGLVDSTGLDVDRIIEGLSSTERVELAPNDDLFPDTLAQPSLSAPAASGADSTAEALRSLVELFEYATTFGSLIQVPEDVAGRLPALKQLSESPPSQDLFLSEALKRLGPLVQQAEFLAAPYDAVVANPPYMGSKGMEANLKRFTKSQFPRAKRDVCACFIERAYGMARSRGYVAMVTMQSWLFQSSFEELRKHMMGEKTIRTLTQIGFNSFPSMNSKVALAAAFSLTNDHVPGFRGSFVDLNGAPHSADKRTVFLERTPAQQFEVPAERFECVPGNPVIYSASQPVFDAFSNFEALSEVALPRQGMATGDDDRYVRLWFEVDQVRIGFGFASNRAAWASGKEWFPFNKGGAFRKWYGNSVHVLAFSEERYEELKTIGNRCPSEELYFLEAVSWSDVAITFGARYRREGEVFATLSMSAFPKGRSSASIAAFLNSGVNAYILNLISPGLHYSVGYVARQPICPVIPAAEALAMACVGISERDWDALEGSWDFQSLPLLTAFSDSTPTVESSYTAWISQNMGTIAEMKRLEEENNRLFIDAYGLADELTPDVPIEQITLTVNPAYRYGGKLTEEEQWTRFRQDTMEELVSYSIGCMMGRYSLDAPGLIYAHSGNEGFDPSQYSTFPADDDGIVPLTDTEWFEDDACNRVIEFVSAAWDKSHLEANLTFLAENLSPKKNESSRDTLRRYLCEKFFKVHHLKRYKKRPIYWLFSSGKQKAFQCLVYLHRYNEGTLARMRSEYVIPLQGKMAARIEQLSADVQAATSTAHRKRLEKEQEKLTRQQVELLEFDEKLRHYADKRIALDLDDGVKVNYGKFGDLLAEVKAVHGKKAKG